MFLEALPEHVRHLLKRLGRLPNVASFYLAGGSAVALHLGHRISVDLDFFTAQDDYEAQSLLRDLQSVGHLVVRQQDPGTLNATLEDTHVSFFVYPYPLLEALHTLWEVQVAGLPDLALMKLAAIGQRGRKRDFVDLYHICHSGYALHDLLSRMPEKFPQVTYPSYHLLRSLAYFTDAEADPTPSMLVPFDWAEIKQFFECEVKRLIKELL